MDRPTDPRRPRRPGRVVLFLLVVLVALVGAGGLALNTAWLWQARQELQITADAAALAALRSLADDDLLLGDPAAVQRLMADGRTQAQRYGQLNPVQGRPLTLDANPTNLPAGDVVFGVVDRPGSRQLNAAENVTDPSNDFLTRVNAVRVTARQTRATGNPVRIFLGRMVGLGDADVTASATAMFDRDVIGFRPPGTQQPIPLAPLALRSDPSRGDPLSWEFLVAAGNGPDAFRLARPSLTLVADPSGDGRHEMAVTLADPNTPATLATANGCLLTIGTGSAAEVGAQFAGGITPGQLAGLGGAFILGSDGTLSVTGTPVGPDPATPAFESLREGLDALRESGAARAWPLYSSCDPAAGTAVVSGFVAARVAAVSPPGVPLTFTLQPAFLTTRTAVTAPGRPVGGVTVTNPYIARIRLVE